MISHQFFYFIFTKCWQAIFGCKYQYYRFLLEASLEKNYTYLLRYIWSKKSGPLHSTRRDLRLRSWVSNDGHDIENLESLPLIWKFQNPSNVYLRLGPIIYKLGFCIYNSTSSKGKTIVEEKDYPVKRKMVPHLPLRKVWLKQSSQARYKLDSRNKKIL